MKRVLDESRPLLPAVVAWKSVAALAAERRDATVWLEVTLAIPAIGRSALSRSSSAEADEYRHWRRLFNTLHSALHYNLDIYNSDARTVRRISVPQLHKVGKHEWLYDDQLYCVDNSMDDPSLNDSLVSRSWYRNGVRHRVGAPALEECVSRCCTLSINYPGMGSHIGHKCGYKRLEWFDNGRHHRVGGPAVTLQYWCYDPTHSAYERYKDGKVVQELWYEHGQCHRDGAPAFFRNHMTMWYKRGQLHRDGNLPAVEHHDSGHRECWVHGKFMGRL